MDIGKSEEELLWQGSGKSRAVTSRTCEQSVGELRPSASVAGDSLRNRDTYEEGGDSKCRR